MSKVGKERAAKEIIGEKKRPREEKRNRKNRDSVPPDKKPSALRASRNQKPVVVSDPNLITN